MNISEQGRINSDKYRDGALDIALASDRLASRDPQKELPKQGEYLRILDTIRSDFSDRGFVLGYN